MGSCWYLPFGFDLKSAYTVYSPAAAPTMHSDPNISTQNCATGGQGQVWGKCEMCGPYAAYSPAAAPTMHNDPNISTQNCTRV